MAGPGTEASPTAEGLLSSLDVIDLERYQVVGNYVRFEESVRVRLGELRQRVVEAVSSGSRGPTNFLLWGAPGSGKTFLATEIGNARAPGRRFLELNLAELDEPRLASALERLSRSLEPTLCLVDEVDARPDRSWPYELLLPALEPPSGSTGASTCFLLAGSGGANLEEMKARIRARPKGPDLLSRIPAGSEFVVPALTPADRILVSASQLVRAARDEGRPIREVEKLALYYLATQPGLVSARQLRSVTFDAARRLPLGEDRIRYDHLFRSGDPENKRFWTQTSGQHGQLEGRFVLVKTASSATAEVRPPEPLVGAPRAMPPSRMAKIAVLPFANLSADPSDEFFADGMTEELIARLSSFSPIRVIARTSAMHYKGSNLRAAEIARELGVDSLLEGSLRRSGNRIRLTVQLVDCRTESPVWATQYDRDLEDVLAVQTEVATKVAASIESSIPSEAVGEDLVEPDAYLWYLRATQLFHGDTDASLRETIALCERAVAREPSFAPPRCLEARAWIVLALIGAEPWSVILERAEPTVRRALELQPGLADAHSVMADVLVSLDRFEDGIAEAEAAIRLNPSDAAAHSYLGFALSTLGHVDQGLTALRRAHDLDPVDARTGIVLAGVAQAAGRLDEAESLFAKMRKLHAGSPNVLRHVAQFWGSRGRFVAASELLAAGLSKAPGDAMLRSGQAILEAMQGHRVSAVAILRELADRGGLDRLDNAELIVRATLGDVDEAFRLLDRAADRHSWPFLILSEGTYSPLRSDPRFAAVCERLGLPAPPPFAGSLGTLTSCFATRGPSERGIAGRSAQAARQTELIGPRRALGGPSNWPSLSRRGVKETGFGDALPAFVTRSGGRVPPNPVRTRTPGTSTRCKFLPKAREARREWSRSTERFSDRRERRTAAPAPPGRPAFVRQSSVARTPLSRAFGVPPRP
jgi:TolB-like protein/tetratricopeptide (TPR) repeat protein